MVELAVPIHMHGLSDQPALTDYWAVHNAHFDAVQSEIDADLAEHPELGPYLRSIDPKVAAEEHQASRALQERALLHGEWEPYTAHLTAMGEGYARSGLSLASWFDAIRSLRTHLMPRLFAAYSTDPSRLERVTLTFGELRDHVMATIGEAYLLTKEELIAEQQAALRERSTPVLQLREGLLLLPLIGTIDGQRARQFTDQLLSAIGRQRASVVVIDLTGVAAVDTSVANHLMQSLQAARLLGAYGIITGLSAAAAETLAQLGLGFGGAETVGDLQDGLEIAFRRLNDGRIAANG
jgi:rsbT co-antagonist protein RsbR